MRKNFLLIWATFLIMGCSESTEYINVASDPKHYHAAVNRLTDAIVHDIFSPPVASRIYAYPNIAAYEVLSQSSEKYISLAGQLNELGPTPAPPASTPIDFSVAAMQAFLKVGQALVFSEDKISDFREEYVRLLKDKGIPNSILKASTEYGEAVGEHILAYADKDNYKQTRTFPKYTIRNEPYAWKPTPPDYMEGIEPHWNKIRPFLLDSAQQYRSKPPTPFSLEKGSDFYEEIMEVYEVVNQATDEQVAMAKFWDCNPYVSHHRGHVMFATKKITPGGHWMGIAGLASRKAGKDLPGTTEAYTRTAIALADSFIACWDEKWRSVLVRPETVINEYIDEDWAPLLQTPPFPEHNSGHSVVSGTASVVLTDFFGDNFFFSDSTEIDYGLPVRDFESFTHAAEEAAISRLYGGIHYRPSIEYGLAQGKKVGQHVLSNLKTQAEPAANLSQISE